ncbi:serine protease Hayan-like isoform X2 [Spodoptera frugiperda]|uniref:Serine protease Hayan-like isoform X2 n=1 Tax=Spodoptera frugiperda TaxID=7108 RepID=A0A9R0DGV7_SPOFR|nr:serine protease Hayan-like isoform X2 [Spodoptera frugiperda]
MKLTAIIMFLIPVVVARHNHRTLLETILKSKGNVYSKVDDDVQSVMNNLFDSLNLAPDFPSRSRIKLLLTMHYDLKSIAEKNFEAHDRMLDAAEVSIDNNTATGIALITIIGDILDNKPFNLSSTLYGKYVPRKRTKHKKESHVPRAVTTTSTTTETILETTTSQPVFADSKEFVEFIHDFIKKIDQLSENDFSKPVAGEPVAMPVSPEEDDDDNLEYWEPPPVLELDFVNDTNSRRIFKGKRSRVKSYPFMVSIHLMGTFTCAGSILTRDLVISAASCLQLLHNNRFYRENPSALTVRVGSDFFARGGEIIPVVETYFHPGYDPKTLANNLVMLRLYKHIRFLRKERKVKRIRFDRTPANLATNTENIIVIGWGARKKSNVIDQFERMLVAKLDIYQVNECAEIYSPTFVTDKNFCAGFISNGGGACNKDVGGPGVVGGTLIGVISFGAPVCGAIDSPTVFTKLGYYGKWIDSVIRTYGLVVGARTTPKPQTHQQYSYTSSTTVRINPFFSIHSTLGPVLPVAVRNREPSGPETVGEVVDTRVYDNNSIFE